MEYSDSVVNVVIVVSVLLGAISGIVSESILVGVVMSVVNFFGIAICLGIFVAENKVDHGQNK